MLARLVLTAALLSVPVFARAAEERVTFSVGGMTVVGTLNMPEGVANPPAVLLLHGFTGSRDELEIPSVKEGIYARAARLWSAEGIASLRIDYRYNGDSDGEFADSTLEAHIADGLAALDWLARSGRVDPSRLGLVGWSMGGAVGAAVAARAGETLDAVALWAPGTNMASAIALMFGAEKFKEGLAAKDQPVTVTLPWGAEIALKSGFFESLYAVDPVAEITRYSGPLFVAVGTKDDVVYPQPVSGQVLLDYHTGDEELFVREMDHVFNAFAGVEQVDELIAATGAFIRKNLD
ncbi:alpha/beta hydrolase family protein [Aquibium microcysteis]|uniref:alpha/beta hydrolase family protein n=1 Tax=Aquibium microcysteis TaxID=675281 RepID=UPI00165CF990|nr:alpha/beta fold hydrolase [Aquibium microcysteis]